MTLEQHKLMMRRLVDEVFNRGDRTAIEELFAPHYLHYAPSNDYRGRHLAPAEIHDAVQALRSRFVELHYTVEDVMAEADKAMIRVTARATLEGEVLTRIGTVRASGTQATYPVVMIARFKGGQIVEMWETYDDLSRLQQFGALPRP